MELDIAPAPLFNGQWISASDLTLLKCFTLIWLGDWTNMVNSLLNKAMKPIHWLES
jgi:hypothetical protein